MAVIASIPTFPLMTMHDESNELFALAVRFVNQTDKHLFITGKAGTGKTTFLKYIKENAFKNLVIVAPTGVSAINAGGVTIHSFFQLPFGPFIAAHKSGWNQQQAVTNQHTLIKNIRFNANKKQLIRELEMLIIDEVSMMRCDMLDAIDHVLRHFRGKPHIPFGGVQMVYIGDLFQLPPVVNNEEWELMKETYNCPFFFDAQVIQQSPPLYLELKKIYRQSEASFIDILNNIRNNQVTRDDLEELHHYYQPAFLPGKKDNYITLTSHNAKADYINRRELDNLTGGPTVFSGVIKGDFSEKALPAEMNLQLKEGAQVMFLKNDKGEKRRYFNGKIATVCRITTDEIFIRFPDAPAEMQLEKETWKNIRYTFNEEKNRMEEEEVGTFTQFPVRLAWAITIHKSQGLTFEKAIIDAGSSFAAGQVYVALSRLTSLAGLILYSKIHPDSISTDPRVIQFTQHEKNAGVLQSILKQEQFVFTERMLMLAFSWSKVINGFEKMADSYTARTIEGKVFAAKWASEMLAKTLTQDQIARKFVKQIQQLLSFSDQGNHALLRERIISAEKYFSDQLTILHDLLDKHIKEFKMQKRVKQYLLDLEKLNSLISLKKKELKNALEMVEDLVTLKETDPSTGSIPVPLHTDQNPLFLPREAPLHQ